MSKTKWENLAAVSPCLLSEKDRKEHELIWLGRRLHNMVNYQINQLRGDKTFEEVLSLSSRGQLLSDNPDIMQLIRLREDGIFERHQFEDAEANLTQTDYNTWYNNAVRNTFFYTIKAGDIFKAYSKSTPTLSSMIVNHSGDEINSQSFYGYSIGQILGTLYHIDPFLIFNLFFRNVQLEIHDGREWVTGDYEKDNGQTLKVLANFAGKKLYIVGPNGKIKPYMNMYEFMFKHYRKPIFEVFNSVNHVINPYVCPGEGIGKYTYDSNISAQVEEITKSETHKKVRSRHYNNSIYFN